MGHFVNRAIFLDRDGVINQPRIEGDKTFSPRCFQDFQIISGVKESIEIFKKMGFLVIVVTNQPDIARAKLDPQELERMHQHLLQELSVDEVMVCPHDDKDECDCRKPKPGMLLSAAQKWSIDLKNSVLVGDRNKDIFAGQSAGCKTILITNPAQGDCQPDYVIESLAHLCSNKEVFSEVFRLD